MQFTLITSKGQVMQFFIKAVADLYCNLYGGVVVTNDILNEVQEVSDQVSA